MHHVHRATHVLMAPAALVLALLALTPVPASAAEELAVTQIRSSPFATGISLLSATGGRRKQRLFLCPDVLTRRRQKRVGRFWAAYNS